MWTDQVRVAEEVSAADWLTTWLTGRPATVTGTVPDGFAAYARILHPVEFDGQGAPLTWSHVADITGRTVHPTVQWHALIGADSPYAHGSELWPDGQPHHGNLRLPELMSLCDELTAHTSAPQDCFFALWAGWAQLSGGRAWAQLTSDGQGAEPSPLLTPHERTAPRVQLPGRDYFLLRGPLTAMADLVQYERGGWSTQSPSLFWPADRSWCVATEIDFDSTLVGGSAAAIDAVLASPALEALPIQRGNSLMANADRVNA